MTRPEPPVVLDGDLGLEPYVVAEDTSGWHSWTTDPAIIDGKRCRFGSPWTGYCGRPAVAALDRARDGYFRRLWYGYCDDPAHLYGRWIEDGRVVTWRFRRIESTARPSDAARTKEA